MVERCSRNSLELTRSRKKSKHSLVSTHSFLQPTNQVTNAQAANQAQAANEKKLNHSGDQANERRKAANEAAQRTGVRR